MDILRFITAGNVDDGKSTLIGRLLYDTGNIKDDVLQSVSEDDTVNLAHITDGLRSERAQGITIDVAYKYFATSHRKYIIADAPGHFQYTRNLVTGASAADAIILLVDVKNGITQQTKIHSLVASFLHISKVIVAVNKMDAVGWSESVFKRICTEYQNTIAGTLQLGDVCYIPISALIGDNVTEPSQKMPWHTGDTLMQTLDKCTPAIKHNDTLRFVVQYTSADEEGQHCFGKVISGKVSVGDTITVYPSCKQGLVKEVTPVNPTDNSELSGQNISVLISSEHSLQRGDIIGHATTAPTVANKITATVCWLDTTAMEPGMEYVLQMNGRNTVCKIEKMISKIDVATLAYQAGNNALHINEFADVEIHCADEMAVDAFASIPEMGRGILINRTSNYTCAAFTVRTPL